MRRNKEFDTVERCGVCRRMWARNTFDSQVSCTVAHAPGDCCHYGWTEVALESVGEERESQ